MHLILLPNDSIFRALSDDIYRIFSVPDPKNTFCVINQYLTPTAWETHFIIAEKLNNNNKKIVKTLNLIILFITSDKNGENVGRLWHRALDWSTDLLCFYIFTHLDKRDILMVIPCTLENLLANGKIFSILFQNLNYCEFFRKLT